MGRIFTGTGGTIFRTCLYAVFTITPHMLLLFLAQRELIWTQIPV